MEPVEPELVKVKLPDYVFDDMTVAHVQEEQRTEQTDVHGKDQVERSRPTGDDKQVKLVCGAMVVAMLMKVAMEYAIVVQLVQSFAKKNRAAVPMKEDDDEAIERPFDEEELEDVKINCMASRESRMELPVLQGGSDMFNVNDDVHLEIGDTFGGVLLEMSNLPMDDGSSESMLRAAYVDGLLDAHVWHDDKVLQVDGSDQSQMFDPGSSEDFWVETTELVSFRFRLETAISGYCISVFWLGTAVLVMSQMTGYWLVSVTDWFLVNNDHDVDNVGKVINKDVEISIENSYSLGDNLLISEGDSASYNEEVELRRDDGQVDKAISTEESQVKFSPSGENEGLPPSFPPSISITLYGVSMEISIEYLGYVFGSCVSRLGVDLFGDLVDDFFEMEWLLRYLFIDLDLEIHQGGYRRYLISLNECLSDDEGEESLLGSEDSGQVSMSDSELEIDSIALDDEEEIDEGVLLGLPRGLYCMLLPRDQRIVLYRQTQPYGIESVLERLLRVLLITGNSPPNKPPYRVSQAQQEEIMRQVNELVEKGMVRPSSSPFCSPVLLVHKKDGTYHMCVKYRALNRITIKNRFFVPRIEDLFDKLQWLTYFSRIDLKSGYHQIRIVNEDIVKTAFHTTFGLYEYLVMSFGLTNAPTTFNRMMERIF
ncbi:hypothetical protein L7F22_000387 [Adiantum nelumboides]|nr:hypothetical protein [Adiantum nelumboides]